MVRPGMFLLGLVVALLAGLLGAWAVLIVGYFSFLAAVTLSVLTTGLLAHSWLKRFKSRNLSFSFKFGFLVTISILQLLLFVLFLFYRNPKTKQFSRLPNPAFNPDPRTRGPVNFLR